MNLQQLRYLLATIDTGTMTGAATALHMSQPALTRALRALEDELGLSLLVRVGRRVELTSDGRKVEELARRVVRDADAIAAVRNDATTRICATVTQARELCAGAMSRLAGHPPAVRVAIDTVDSADAVVERVASGQAELGVCDLPVTESLRCIVLGTQELALICPSSWDIPDPMPLQMLDGMNFIVPPEGQRRRAEVDALFAQLDVTPTIAVTVDQRELTVPMVLQGVGATFAWPASARAARDQGARVVRTVPAAQRTVVAITRPGRLAPGTRSALRALKDEAASILLAPRDEAVGVSSTTIGQSRSVLTW